MNAHKILIIVLCILITSSITVIVYDRYAWKDYGAEKIRAFQQYVCGFGLGASVNPGWGFLNFDPRVDSVDETGLFPVPGGYSYSPDCGLSVSEIKENPIY